MEKQSKRFEDWIEVDCQECERWWTNQCDAKPHLNRSKIPCNSFLATRSIVIPEQIKTLQKANKKLWWVLSMLIGFNIGFWVLWIIWFMKG